MFGLAGIAGYRRVNDQSVRTMMELMVCSSPDDAGLWTSEKRRITLGHRRLASASFSLAKITSAFGRFVASHLPENADLLVGWSSATLETIKPARARGMKIVVERGPSHIVHQTETLSKHTRITA